MTHTGPWTFGDVCVLLGIGTILLIAIAPFVVAFLDRNNGE